MSLEMQETTRLPGRQLGEGSSYVPTGAFAPKIQEIYRRHGWALGETKADMGFSTQNKVFGIKTVDRMSLRSIVRLIDITIEKGITKEEGLELLEAADKDIRRKIENGATFVQKNRINRTQMAQDLGVVKSYIGMMMSNPDIVSPEELERLNQEDLTTKLKQHLDYVSRNKKRRPRISERTAKAT